MKKSIYVKLFLFLVSLILCSCKYGLYSLLFNEDDVDDRSSSLTVLSSDDIPDVGDSSLYSFVVFTDPHFGASAKRYDDEFLTWYENQLCLSDESLRPRFAVCLGDCADSGESSEYDDYNSVINKIIELGNEAFSISNYHVYSTIGNHDLYNNGYENYKKKVYPYKTYYKFSVCSSAGEKYFTYFFLDSANGTLGDEQLDDFAEQIKEDSNPKIIFTHYPVYAGGNILMTMQNTTERNLLLTLFEKYNAKEVLEGHAHKNYGYDYGDFEENVTASYLYSRQCRLVTVNEDTEEVSTAVIDF
ncbi:MAG: metallophosphoesterase [Treponema sp.]|nr:metallophosphoesterase [Treponema sp.]